MLQLLVFKPVHVRNRVFPVLTKCLILKVLGTLPSIGEVRLGGGVVVGVRIEPVHLGDALGLFH